MADLRLECTVRHHDRTSTARAEGLNDGDVMDDRVPSFNQRKGDVRHRSSGEPRTKKSRPRSTRTSERGAVGGQEEHEDTSSFPTAAYHFPHRPLTESELQRDSEREPW